MRPRAVLAVALCCAALCVTACSRRSSLPAAIGDREFWPLIEAVSEPPGTFSLSDNLLSNEPHVAENIRWLAPKGGVYIGVGPEQNFSYIEKLRPAMAFIVDIRRENLVLHLFYKALFELSADRADFVSRLFSRARPDGLDTSASVEDIFARYARVPASPELLSRDTALVRERLLGTRGLPLTQVDLEWIDRVFKAFYSDGPEIRFWGTSDVKAVQPSYRELMTAKDLSGQTRSFLASEEGFRFVKDLQSKNLVVPVVGDFGGPSALRRVGDYVRRHRDVVRAFYGSNVGVYLTTRQTRAFCGSLESLPVPSGAWFIERDGVRLLSAKLRGCSPATK